MKTLLSTFLGLVLLASQAQAESRFGVVAGVNLAKLASDSAFVPSQGHDAKTGFIEGLAYQTNLNDTLFIETQLRYLEKGGTLGQAKATLGYLNLPIYVKYKHSLGGSLTPFVFAGPAGAVKVGAKVGTVEKQEARNRFNAFDLSVDAGLGAEWAASETINISLSGAYSYGLVNVASDRLDASLGGASLKTRGINIAASVLWKI